jgi:hypothetical protein
MNARFLGSSPLTIRVKCPCGLRDNFSRQLWETTGYARCPCGRWVEFGTLTVFDAKEFHRFMWVEQSELKELRGMEDELRSFVEYFDHHAGAYEQRGSQHHPFAPRTVEMVATLRPILKRLDESRQSSPETS